MYPAIRVGLVENAWDIDKSLQVNGSGTPHLDIAMRVPKTSGQTKTFIVMSNPQHYYVLRSILPWGSLTDVINTPGKFRWYCTLLTPDEVIRALRCSQRFQVIE